MWNYQRGMDDEFVKIIFLYFLTVSSCGKTPIKWDINFPDQFLLDWTRQRGVKNKAGRLVIFLESMIIYQRLNYRLEISSTKTKNSYKP